MRGRWVAVAAVALGALAVTSAVPVWGEPDVTVRGDARMRTIMRQNHDFNSDNGPTANRRVVGDENFVDHRERLYLNGKVGDDFEAMFQWNIGNHQLGAAGTPPTERPPVATIGESVRQLWVDVRFPLPAPYDKWHLRVGRQFIDFGQGLVFGDRRNGTDSLWFYGPLGPGRLTFGFFQISEGDAVFNDDWAVYGAKYRWPVGKDHSIEPYFLYSVDYSNLRGPSRAGNCRQPTSPDPTSLTSDGLQVANCQDQTTTWFLGANYQGRVGTRYGELKLWFDGAFQGGERVFSNLAGTDLLQQNIDAWGWVAGAELSLPRRVTRGIPVKIGLEGGYGTGDSPQAPNAAGLDPSTNTHFGIMSNTIRFRDRFPGLSNYQFGNFIDEALAGSGPDTLTLGGGAASPTGATKRTRSATFNGVSNQYVIMPKVVVRPYEQLEVDVRWARHWAVEPSSAASIANNFLTDRVPVRNPGGTALDSHLGDDVGLVANWFMHKNVVLTGYFLWFFPGDFFKVNEVAGTTTGTPDTARTIRLEIVGRF